MPANSVDTLFACILIIMVVIMSMVATSTLVSPHLEALEDVNEEEYLRKIVEHAIVNAGSTSDWGKNQSVAPAAFGLAEADSVGYVLDVDKVSRLNNRSVYSLTYLEVLQALRLQNVALKFSFSQILDVSITLDSNTTVGDSTAYSFSISVTQNQAPTTSTLQCYIIANNFLNSTNSSTSSNGQGTVEFEIPNNSNGTALFVVFARSPDDSRLTAQGVYAFGHLSSEPSENSSFLTLSPLNYTLQVDPNVSGVSLESAYGFSYGYNSSLTSISNETYTIPNFLGSSPQLLVVTGWDSTDFFVEWVAYPQVPLEIGPDFEGAECFALDYVVTINDVFYRLNVQCGGPSL